jgi:phosphohistidine phosphatase SixA
MIVFVLRHADKQRSPPGADDLTSAGVRRAELLARMLAESEATVAYCSTAVRAQRTLEPLKATLGPKLKINPVDINGPGQPDKHVSTIVSAIKLLPPETIVVVVSHSDTVSPIIEGLVGGAPIGDLDDRSFDQLFLLVIPSGGEPTILRLRYGEPT